MLPVDQKSLQPGLQLVVNQLPDELRSASPKSTALARLAARSVIAAGVDLESADGKSALFLRVPSHELSSSDIEEFSALFSPSGVGAPDVSSLALPGVSAKQFTFDPTLAGPLAGFTESITTFEHAGWTYVIEFVTKDPAADEGTSTALVRSVRVEGA
ncbi:MAG: hypothetical protein JO086_05310 [Acidimicrobiia bacterium]|nr:hypothetical protein [Acidimicrobiia bacterium]